MKTIPDRVEATQIKPFDYICFIDIDTTPFEFSRTLRKYFKRTNGPASFFFNFPDWVHALQLCKYVDELPGEAFDNGD